MSNKPLPRVLYTPPPETPPATRVYLAGPMRGYPRYNFDAFDRAAEMWREEGYDVFSPAERDREMGFDPDGPVPDGFLREAMAADLGEVCRADIVAVLPGWERSRGARLEVAVARQLEPPAPIYDAANMEELAPRWVEDALNLPPGSREFDSDASILDAAKRLTEGDRNRDYGHPRPDFARTANLWTVLLQDKLLDDEVISPEDIGLCMIALKLSREVHKHKRDNLVDIAGYARTLAILARDDRFPPDE